MKVSDFELFIPVRELHLSNGHKYRIYAQLSLYSDPGKKGEFLAESDFLPITVDLTDPNHPKAIPDFSQVITVAEVDKAKKEGRQVGVTTRKNPKQDKKSQERAGTQDESQQMGLTRLESRERLNRPRHLLAKRRNRLNSTAEALY